MKAKLLIQLLVMLWPWRLRRLVLVKACKFELDPSAKIGLSLILARKVTLRKGAKIGHMCVVKGLELLHLGEFAIIGNGNWASGNLKEDLSFFDRFPDRISQLIVEDHAAITNQHRIDCSDSITIGKYATLAGWGSQILTHSIDLEISRQGCAPVVIGEYCFVGTRSVILAGSKLPNRSVLGAASLLQRAYEDELWLYAGVPAKPVKQLSADMLYFSREFGPVN